MCDETYEYKPQHLYDQHLATPKLIYYIHKQNVFRI